MPARLLQHLPSLALIPLVAACGGSSGGANLLLVTLDTVRADHLGCYGYDQATTPVLDRLAARSLLFEAAIAQSAVTPVSHASILTGLNPHRHRLRSLHGGDGYTLPGEVPTLAELMAHNGFATAAFVSAFPATRHFGLERGFEVWDEDFRQHGGRGIVADSGVVDTARAQRRADETTERALGWLRDRDSRPFFFLWIHYFDVHDTVLQPPAEYLSRFPAASEAERDRLLAIYDAELAYVDAQLGRVLGALDDSDDRERTVVAVMADHGEGLGDHDWWHHSLLFQEQVRIPFLLAVPGSGWSGRIRSLVRAIDLVPTLVDVLALECPSGPCDFDGASLRPLAERRASPPRVAYSESLNDLAAYQESPMRDDSLFAVNDGRWKLIARYRGRRAKSSQLFDLESDPGETEDLAELEPQIRQRLQDHLEGLEAVAERRPLAPLDPRTRERLESLGYLD